MRWSPGGACCGCREFDKTWCGIADSTEAAAAGVTLTGSEYSIDFDLPDYDWSVIVTFPEIRERDDYYAGGYCGDGTDWGSGEFKHIIRVTDQDDVILLRVDLTISKDVSGVDDHVLIEVLETTNSFDAVLLRDYSLTSDKNGGRYIPSLRLTRREGITAIEFGGLQMLVDATPDGESFESLTLSTALYATTEGTAGDTMRVSVESAWISGDYADPTGDWIVVGFEVANETEATNPDCPDPRICAVNDSTYSTPQWTTSNVDIDIDGVTEQALDWRKVFSGCVITLDQPGRKTITLPTTDSDSFAPDYYGRFYAVNDPYSAIPNSSPRFTWYGTGINNIQSIAAYTDAFTGLDANQSFAAGISPEITISLLPSANVGKRIVRAEMDIPIWYDLAPRIFSNGTQKLLLWSQKDKRDFQDWPNGFSNSFRTAGFDPPIASQVTFDVANVLDDRHYGYFDDAGVAYMSLYNPATNTFGSPVTGTQAPTGLVTETVHSPPAIPSPLYVLVQYRSFDAETCRIVWEKEVDEWDGEPPIVEFEAADIVSTLSAFQTDTAVDIITGSSMVYDATETVTVRYLANPSNASQTYTMPVYLFDLNLTIETVDLTAATLTINPTTGPMPQPITP